jgi:predicted enzyme related to lactoylglutathione lyase
MGILDMSGVELQARDWDALLAWYQEVLGMTVIVVEEDDRFAMLQAPGGGAILHLASDHPDLAASTEENRLGPVFNVDDFDAVLGGLKSKGVKVDPVVDGEGDGYRLARFWDPEGNRLHIAQME